MPDLIQQISWPGVLAVERLQATVSHGISPGVFTLTTYPQTAMPQEYGTLVFGDGFNTVVLPDCKVMEIDGQMAGDGQVYVLRIADRRWRWALGSISGTYNDADTRGKLIPWTIRSPEELANLCLAQMGEQNFQLVLPQGLKEADGANLDDYLKLGENFQQSLTNPKVVWENTVPAEALARLAELFQCRVIYQASTDGVLVAPLGVGGPFPDGPCEVIAPSINAPRVPERVGVVGAPVRIQCRLLLEAVGKDWDGEYVPVNDLSFKPTSGWAGANSPSFANVKATDRLSYTQAVALAQECVFKCYRVKDANVGGPGASGPTAPQGVIDFVSNRPPAAADPFAGGGELRGKPAPAVPPPPSLGSIAALLAGGVAGAAGAAASVGQSGGQSLADPDLFVVVPNNPRGNIVLPWFGRVQRRQQLILQPTKVDQVSPTPRTNVGQAANSNQLNTEGILPEFYNGYSRDRPAVVYGRVSRDCLSQVVWNGVSNTPTGEVVRVPFTIDPVEQLVVFASPVWRSPTTGTLFQDFPSLVLETAVLVKGPRTSAFVRYERSEPVPGGEGPPEWGSREDCQASVVGQYAPAQEGDPDDRHNLIGFRFVDLADANARADLYIGAMADKYTLKDGGTRQFVGIYPIDLDGFIQQVSWSLGPGGPTTVASGNSEHSPFVLPYPARRRAENLPPNAAAAAANLTDRANVRALTPRPPGAATS